MRPQINVRQSTANKARARILTVDPPTRRVEAGIRDGIVQVRVVETGTFFRWPKQGEMWSIYKEGEFWRLGQLMEEGDQDLSVEALTNGQGKVYVDELYNELGARFLTNQDVVPGSGDKTYVHNQGSANATWTIDHPLAKFPAVSVVDSAGDEVEAQVHYTSDSQVVLTFSSSFGGKAYLN